MRRCHINPSARCSVGFTLVEVLVALAILAVALAAAVRAATSYADSTAHLRQQTLALWVAANHLTEMHLRQEWPKPDHYTGSSTMAGREWHWRMTVSATLDPAMRRVEIQIYSDAHRKQAVATLTGFVGEPQSADF